MRKRCRDVDICSTALVRKAVLQCLAPAKKRRRYDTVRLFARTLGITRSDAERVLKERGELYTKACFMIADALRDDIEAGDLRIRKAVFVDRTDSCSRKTRKVAVLGIRELLLDHVAVLGLAELARSIGEYQVSSIPGRGTTYGDMAVRRWIRGWGKAPLYAVKLDIRNFYGSVKQDILVAWIRRRVGNRRLVWLVESLLGVVDDGMAIGSFLSQTIANIYLSDLYHRIKEVYMIRRRGRRINVFRHALFYMDDMLLLGSNKRAMRAAVCDLTTYAQSRLGLCIKDNWHVRRVTDRHPVDISGFRYYPDGSVSLRRRIYRLARRMVLRLMRLGPSPRRRARLAAYKGRMQVTVSIPKVLPCKKGFHITPAML